MADKKMSLKEQAEAIKKTAAELGLEQNYLFITTFERYEVQLSILDQFKESMEKDGMMIGQNMMYIVSCISGNFKLKNILL